MERQPSTESDSFLTQHRCLRGLLHLSVSHFLAKGVRPILAWGIRQRQILQDRSQRKRVVHVYGLKKNV